MSTIIKCYNYECSYNKNDTCHKELITIKEMKVEFDGGYLVHRVANCMDSTNNLNDYLVEED